jgi:hypothetical protein
MGGAGTDHMGYEKVQRSAAPMLDTSLEANLTFGGPSHGQLMDGGLFSRPTLHVVTVSDDTTAAIYDALTAACQAVVRLDENQSIQDLVQTLGAQPSMAGLNSLHIYSHGQNGAFWIGGDRVDADLLTGQRDTFNELGSLLDEHGDLLIYGCDVGSGDTGMSFLRELAQATGADIAASSDLTGSDGDWDLETRIGLIAPRDAQLVRQLAAITGNLAISPGNLVTNASYIDGNGDQVTIELSGPGAFRLWLAGGRTDGADATKLELVGTDVTTSLTAFATPQLLSINAGSIDAGATGQYNRMYSAGFSNIDLITANTSTAIKDIYLGGVFANKIELDALAVGTITLDTAFSTYVDRVNTSTLGSSINVATPTVTIGTVSSPAEMEIFDESPTGPNNNTYNPVTGLIDIGDISAASLEALVINGATSAETNAPFDSSRLTNDLSGTINIEGRLGSVSGRNSALTGALRAGSIDSIELGLIQGEITTTSLVAPLTLNLPSEFRGFIQAGGHLNLSFNFDYPDPGDTVPAAERIFGEIRAGGGISGEDASLTDTIFIPNQIFNLIEHTGLASLREQSEIGVSISDGIASVAINGIGTLRLKSAGDIGDITASSFAPQMIVEAEGDIGDIEAYLFSEVTNPEPVFPPEPVAIELGGFFQAGGNIGDVKSATSISADLRAGESIGNITALSGGIYSHLIEAEIDIGDVWAHHQEQANTGKLVAKTGNIGDIYLALGDWGANIKAGQTIQSITLDKGSLEQVRVAAGDAIELIKISGSLGGIVGGTIVARNIGTVDVSTTTGTAIDGVLIQAIERINAIEALTYGTTLLPAITPGLDQATGSALDGIRNSQILAGEIGEIIARSYTGSGMVDTIIHAQASDIARIDGHGNQSGLLRVTAVAEQDIGPIRGVTDVQGSGIEFSSFNANTGNIGTIIGAGGVAGGHGIASTYFQASNDSRPGSIGDITAISNAHQGNAIHEVTAYAGTFGTIQASVLGGEGTEPEAPPPPFPTRVQNGNGIVDSYFKGFKNLPSDPSTLGIESIIVDVDSIYGYGIWNSEFSVKDDIGSIDVKTFNNSAIVDATFSTSQGDIKSIFAEALNKGTGILRSTFAAENGSLGVGTNASITARARGTGLTDHGIDESRFTADENIGWIEAFSNGGTAIKSSIFIADNDLSSSGVIQKVVATTNGQNLIDSAGINASEFTGSLIGPIEIEVQNYEGGSGILGSTFTGRTASYDGKGNFDNRGVIGSITVTNQSRTGHGIESSRFFAGAGGSIGDISVDVIGNKTDGASGKGIYLSTFQASSFDMDQNVWDGKIGDITIKAGRVIPTLIPSLATAPNDQFSMAAAGIDLSYFAAYGGIGNINIESIGTAVFGSAFLADFDVAGLTNLIGGTLLSSLAAPVPGNLGDITIRTNGRFASGTTLSLFTGSSIGNIDIEANALNVQQPMQNLPQPSSPFQAMVLELLRLAASYIPGATDILNNVLRSNDRFGLAAVVGSVFAALESDIGSIRVTNTGATGKSALASIFMAKENYGPIDFTPDPKAYSLIASAAASLILRPFGFDPAAVYLPDAVLLAGTKRSGRLPENVNPDTLPVATLEVPPGNSPYNIDSLLSFTVNFGAPVLVTGQPSITVQIGQTERIAIYANGSGTSTLSFHYVVRAGDQAKRSEVSVGDILRVDDANSIKYKANNANIPRTNLAIQGSTSELVIDGIAPAVIAWDAPKKVKLTAGSKIQLSARFDEVVIVNGAPYVRALLGKNNIEVRLAYVSGAGTSTLNFEYVLTKKDISTADGDALFVTKTIQLGKARITDASGNNALLDTLSTRVKASKFARNTFSQINSQKRAKSARFKTSAKVS